MYQALYEFKSERPECLSFKLGDRFTVLDETQKDNGGWVLAQNGHGQLGLIPKNYIRINNAGYDEVLQSIDRAIEAIHTSAINTGGVYSHLQRLNLQKLVEHRRNVLGKAKEKRAEKALSLPAGSPINQSKRTAPPVPRTEEASTILPKRSAPPPPPRHGSLLTDASIDGVSDASERRSSYGAEDRARQTNGRRVENAPIWSDDDGDSPVCTPSPTGPLYNDAKGRANLAFRTTVGNAERSLSDGSNAADVGVRDDEDAINRQMTDICIAPNFPSELVDTLRKTTGLSYDKSVQAVCVVLNSVAEHVPAVTSVLARIIASVYHMSGEGVKDVTEDSSHDAQRLRVILSELTTCKDDSQQRSWALYEDEAAILEYLEELVSILENAKRSICCRVVASQGYCCLQNLVQYYQMETRASIRRVMLRMFGALCSLDAIVISSLMCSVLPLELARELQDNMDDTDRASYITLVLSMLYSQGEATPTSHYDHITPGFLDKLLERVETSSEDPQLVDLFIQFFLAFNLHLKSVDGSVTMKALSRIDSAKIFTEKIMLLFNREKDPVRMFDHTPTPPNSVLKLLTDMYSSQLTASILYSNDEKVLIDIIVRQLTDLSAQDKVRREYLQLTNQIVRNSSYATHSHRLPELLASFTSIAHDDGTSSKERAILTDLSSDFPHLFPGLQSLTPPESTA